MPSGFQQDQNQLTPSYYRVIINCGNGNATWYAVDDGNETGTNEGRISPFSWDNFSGNDLPSTQRYANALARGNLRFQYIIEAIENLADCQILDVETNAGTSADDQANNNEVRFTVKFDRDEFVLPALAAIKKAQNFGSDGTTTYDGIVYPAYYAYVDNNDTVNNTQDAIRDVIYDVLLQSNVKHDDTELRSRSVRVFHPVEGADPMTGEEYQEVITTDTPWDNANDAWSDITVQEIDGTTTTLTAD